jgi:hypothetical protein
VTRLNREFQFSFASLWAGVSVLAPIVMVLLPPEEPTSLFIAPIGWLWLIAAPVALVWGSRRLAREHSTQSLLELSLGTVSCLAIVAALVFGEWP